MTIIPIYIRVYYISPADYADCANALSLFVVLVISFALRSEDVLDPIHPPYGAAPLD